MRNTREVHVVETFFYFLAMEFVFTFILMYNIVSRYMNTTSDVLSSVRKMEERLKRLKKGRSTTTNTTAGMSDDDKIRLQLYLDVIEFEQQVSRKVEGNTVTCYIRIRLRMSLFTITTNNRTMQF